MRAGIAGTSASNPTVESPESEPSTESVSDSVRVSLRPRRASGPASSHWARTIVGLLIVIIGAVVVALLVWGVVAARAVQQHARAAADDATQVRSALDRGDAEGSLAGTRAAAAAAAAAHRSASALPLRLASHLPGQAGMSVRAIRTLTSATDLALGHGALPLVDVASTVQGAHGLLRTDGSIDVEKLRSENARVQPAAAALRRAEKQASTVRAAELPRQLREPVRQAQEGISAVTKQAGTAAAALSVLPSALGADGPRSYLVVFQNTAELRPTGGIAGSWALVSVTDGRTQLQDVGNDDDLARVEGPVRDLGEEFKSNYPQDKVAVAQDVNLSPNFPYAGQLYADLWASRGRAAPDGVVAVDPSGMAPLLGGSGTITVDGGPPVNAGNVVDVMLRQVYIDFANDNRGRKKYLSDVIGAAFSEALGGGALNATSFKGLVTAASGHHIMAWSSHPDEQAKLVRAGIAGALPTPSSDRAGVYLTNTSGVYLTNIAASKLDYYLKETITTSGGCDGLPASMRVVLRNDAPEEVPDYVANHVAGVPRTTESLFVAIYVPPRRGVDAVTVNGNQVPFAAGTERGWSLVRFGIQLPRATDTVVQIAFSGAASPVMNVMTQPLVNAADVQPAGDCTG